MHVWAIELRGATPYHRARTSDVTKDLVGEDALVGLTQLADNRFVIYLDTTGAVVDRVVGRLARTLPDDGAEIVFRVRGGVRLALWAVTYRTGAETLAYIGERQGLRTALAPVGGLLAEDTGLPGCEHVYVPDGADVATLATTALGESALVRLVQSSAPAPDDEEGA